MRSCASRRRAGPPPTSAAGTASARRRVSAWKAKYGGLAVSEARRLRTLEDENGRLKGLLADAMLDNAGLKDLLAKKLTPAAKRAAVAHLRTQF